MIIIFIILGIVFGAIAMRAIDHRTIGRAKNRALTATRALEIREGLDSDRVEQEVWKLRISYRDSGSTYVYGQCFAVKGKKKIKLAESVSPMMYVSTWQDIQRESKRAVEEMNKSDLEAA